MSMMFCRGCGAKMHEAASTCPACVCPAESAPVGDARTSGYFGFHGRICHRVFWLHYILPLTAAALSAAILDLIVFGQQQGIFSALVTLATIVPNLAAYVKRLHDRDKSGWFLLILFIPLVGAIWLFIEVGCLRGTNGRNRFGGDSLQAQFRGGPTARLANAP